MADTLRIFTLTIQSSYLQNKELPATEHFDTLQFYARDNMVWRIKTYAIDHDVQIYPINMKDRTVSEVLEFLATSTKEHYGDVLGKNYTLSLENPQDDQAAKAFFTEQGMHPQLVSTEHFAYWNPDGGEYTTQSKPL